MNRKEISINLGDYPTELHSLLDGARVYDSSCSPEARVIFIDRDGGYYLKSAPIGSLASEAALDRYFGERGLGAKVISYLSLDSDWLLTERVRGEDCTHREYLSDPVRLCDTYAAILRELHSLDGRDCPVQNRLDGYFATAERNFRAGAFDPSYADGVFTIDEAHRVVCEGRSILKADTLIHGDYCLPNVMLDSWRFSGFIDLGNGGIGDRHIDLFWGAWTLRFNLGTDEYRERFFDAYGRELVCDDALRVVAAAECFG